MGLQKRSVSSEICVIHFVERQIFEAGLSGFYNFQNLGSKIKRNMLFSNALSTVKSIKWLMTQKFCMFYPYKMILLAALRHKN